MEFKYVKMFHKDEANEYFKKPGFWESANIKQQIGWPQKKTLIEFRNKKLLLLPEDETLLPCIAFRFDKPNRNNDARILISQYLSSLSWVEGRSLNVVGWAGGGPHPFRMAKSSSISLVTSTFQQKYLPDPSDKKTRLALALYREALSLNNVAYNFLSFYKIINLKYAKGVDQKKWIDQNLRYLSDKDAIQRKVELIKNSEIISDYIYVSCRCAIAHAGTNPTVDPENFDDEKRLNQDLPLVKNLSEIMIEREFGVKSRKTFYNEHFYELYGFKELFGFENIQNMIQGIDISKIKFEISVPLSIRLWGKEKYLPFEKLNVNKIEIHDNLFLLECVSGDSLVNFNLELDFPNEHLKFNPLDGIRIIDNGKAMSSLYASEYYRFLADYFTNGQLEVWNSETNECLSQCNAFIPVNIDLSATIINFNKLEDFYKNEYELREK